MDSANETREMYYCCHRGKRPLFIGLAILVIGLLLQADYSLPEILMLIGAILVVKGILVAVFKRENKE